MRTCPSCGKETETANPRCEHCGHPLDREAALASGHRPALGGRAATSDAASSSAAHQSHAQGQARAQVNPPTAPVEAGSQTQLFLLVSDGSERVEREIVLNGQNVTIGRSPTCTVALPGDQLVSRLHAIMHFNGADYMLSDLGSSNGTQVNGVPIEAAVALTVGDRITAGEHTLTFTTAAMPRQAGAIEPREEVAGAHPTMARDSSASVTTPARSAPGAIPPDRDASVSPVAMQPPLPVPAAQGEAGAGARGGPQAPLLAPGDSLGRMVASSGELDEVRARLADTSARLAEVTNGTRQHNKRLLTELTQLSQHVTATLADWKGTAASGAVPPAQVKRVSLVDLAQVAERAVHDPRQIEVILALVGHAGDIAWALRLEQRLVQEFEQLAGRLTELTRPGEW